MNVVEVARLAAVDEAMVEVVEASEDKVIEVEANADWRLAIDDCRLEVVEEISVILEFNTWKLELRVAKLLDKLVPSCRLCMPICCDAAVELANES